MIHRSLILLAVLLACYQTAYAEKSKRGCYGSTICYSAQEAIRARQFPKIHSVSFAGCHIRLSDPFGGQVLAPSIGVSGRTISGYDAPMPPVKNEIIDTFGFGLNCFDSENKRVTNGWAKFDKKKQKWVPRYIDEEDRLQRKKFTKLYPIQAVNSQGFVVTMDDFTGDEERRDRTMHFCLIHSSKALCGDAPVMRLNDPKSNVLPYVLEILRSIEFVDDAPLENPVNATEKP